MFTVYVNRTSDAYSKRPCLINTKACAVRLVSISLWVIILFDQYHFVPQTAPQCV